MRSPHPWVLYSKKLQERVVNPQHVGPITPEQAGTRRLVIGQEGALQEGSVIKLYLLVREADGVIEDARFQAFGASMLIGIADCLCALVINKNYAQASRISAELVEQKLKDAQMHEASVEGLDQGINLALGALFEATGLCQDMTITDPYAVSPVSQGERSGGYHDAEWGAYSHEDKLKIINEVIAVDIAPYIALDAGGIEVKELTEQDEVIVVYQGSCTSCFSAVGATLNAIQQILKDKVHPNIRVTPDPSVLQFDIPL